MQEIQAELALPFGRVRHLPQTAMLIAIKDSNLLVVIIILENISYSYTYLLYKWNMK